MISIAILGHGVVGSGVAEVLLHNEKGITAKAGDSIRVTRILDLRSFPDLPYAHLFTTQDKKEACDAFLEKRPRRDFIGK